MLIDEHVVGMRAYSCWCPHCVRVIGRDCGGMNPTLFVKNCTSEDLRQWEEHQVEALEVKRLETRRKAEEYGAKLAEKTRCVPGEFGMIQARPSFGMHNGHCCGRIVLRNLSIYYKELPLFAFFYYPSPSAHGVMNICMAESRHPRWVGCMVAGAIC